MARPSASGPRARHHNDGCRGRYAVTITCMCDIRYLSGERTFLSYLRIERCLRTVEREAASC